MAVFLWSVTNKPFMLSAVPTFAYQQRPRPEFSTV